MKHSICAGIAVLGVLAGCSTTTYGYTEDASLSEQQMLVKLAEHVEKSNSGRDGFALKFLDGRLPELPKGVQLGTGSVYARALVEEDGHIEHVRIDRAPNRELAELVRAALKTWRFAPFVENGQPTKGVINQRFDFR